MGEGAVVSFRSRDPDAASGQQLMVDFRVRDLDAMLEQLRGRFGWAVDPEGNRFGLWEPA